VPIVHSLIPFIQSVSPKFCILAAVPIMSSTHGLNVFLVDKHIFSSPNSQTIPPIPLSASISAAHPHCCPREAMKTRWADPCFPGFPFIPLSPRFAFEPFRCLGPPRDAFPIEGSGMSWRLAQATIKSFQVLENDLCLIEKALRRAASEVTLTLPSSWRLFPLPHKFGYSIVHATYADAQASALKSRDAFLPLMGWCSCLISHFHEQGPAPESHIFRWEHILFQSKFKLDYIQVLKASDLADFSANYPRAGVFLHHHDPYFQHYVSKYTKFNVPVWIHWGGVGLARPIHNGVLNQYLPSDGEVAAVRKASKSRQAATQNMMDVDMQVTGDVNLSVEAPEPERGSCQRRGEQWHEFFARMDKRRAAFIETESPQAKQARVAKEKAQEAHPPPGMNSRAPRVFEWEEDEKTGFLMRRAITRSYAQDIWDSYSNAQRRYNSTLHEWDLCTALDPHIPNIVGDYTDDDSDSDYGTYVQPPTRRRELLSPFPQRGHDHVSLVTSHELISHAPAILPPNFAVQNVETVSSDPPRRPALSSTPSVNHDDIPTLKHDGTFSHVLSPQTSPTDRNHTSSATTCELASGHVSPTLLSRTSVVPGTDAKMSLSLPSPPLTITPTPPDAVPSEAPTWESAPVPPAIALPPSAAEDEGARASARGLPGQMVSADDATGVSADLVQSEATRDLAHILPTVAQPPSAAENEGARASARTLPGWVVSAEDVTWVAADLVPSEGSTCELGPVPPIVALPPSVAESKGAGASVRSSLGQMVGTEGITEVSAEPGRMHAIIYNGLPTPPSSLHFPGTLLDKIYGRYGFIGMRGDVNTYQSTMPWLVVQKILGDVKSHVERSLEAPISYFLEELLFSRADLHGSLASLWDLTIDSVAPLIDHRNHRFRLIVRPTSTSDSSAIYFIEAKNSTSNDVNWQLVLKDAATVLECFRQEDATSIRDIALFLLQHGTPFGTCIQKSQIQSRLLQPSMPRLLGWRPAGHRPAISEYNFYEDLRRAFFDHPRSRAARLKGGILWRLALEGGGGIVDDHVLDGPSDEVLACGTCIASHNSPESLWDDDLTEAEMDLICGVYHVDTSKSEKHHIDVTLTCLLGTANQTSDLSWWPKQSTFLKSGLWPGYWSPSCEDWFQHRHDSITSGKGDLKTATQWCKSLVLYQKVAKLRNLNSVAATLYIEDHCNLLQ
jgi:hypothetical protein